MDHQTIIEILNELLERESRSILPRLGDNGVFVSWASAEERQIVAGMIAEQQEHRAWLVEAIHDLGGAPQPVSGDIHAAGLHYLDLSYILPTVLDDARSALSLYEAAATRIGDNALAAEVVGRIIARHRRHVETLDKLSTRAAAPAT